MRARPPVLGRPRDLRLRLSRYEGGVTFEEYDTPKTINFIAQVGPARGAWFQDPDGNVFGLREGPMPGATDESTV